MYKNLMHFLKWRDDNTPALLIYWKWQNRNKVNRKKPRSCAELKYVFTFKLLSCFSNAYFFYIYSTCYSSIKTNKTILPIFIS